MQDCLVPGADICIHVREVKQAPPGYKSPVAPHKHEVRSVYNILGGLTMEITSGEEKHPVTGPASGFIPAGMNHSTRPLKVAGYLFMTEKSGKYE